MGKENKKTNVSKQKSTQAVKSVEQTQVDTVKPAGNDVRKKVKGRNEIDYRDKFTLFGDDLLLFDYAAARIVKAARKMDDVFDLGGVLQNNKHDYEIIEKIGPTEFKVAETKTRKLYFLKVEASKMPSWGPKLARYVHIMMTSRNVAAPFQKHFLKMVDRGLIQGSYNFVVFRLGGLNLEDLRRSGPVGQQFKPSTALRLCMQTLQAVHDVHLCHHLHRNIQPKNFVVGLGNKSNVVYVIGFQLADQYYPKRKNEVEMQGRLVKFPWLNLVFLSRAAHRGDKLFRHHDLESWLYMCYDFFHNLALPWKKHRLDEERCVYNFKRFFFLGGFDFHLEKCSPKALAGLRHMISREFSPVDYAPYGELLALIGNLLADFTVDWNAPFEFQLGNRSISKLEPKVASSPTTPPHSQQSSNVQPTVDSLKTKTAYQSMPPNAQQSSNVQPIVDSLKTKTAYQSLSPSKSISSAAKIELPSLQEVSAMSGVRMENEEGEGDQGRTTESSSEEKDSKGNQKTSTNERMDSDTFGGNKKQ